MNTIEFCAFSTTYANVTIAAHEDHEISHQQRIKIQSGKQIYLLYHNNGHSSALATSPTTTPLLLGRAPATCKIHRDFRRHDLGHAELLPF